MPFLVTDWKNKGIDQLPWRGCCMKQCVCICVYARVCVLKMGELTVVCGDTLFWQHVIQNQVFSYCNKTVGSTNYIQSALHSHGCEPVDLEGQLRYFSIHSFLYLRRDLEQMPCGYRRTTVLLNCKSCPRFGWVVFVPMRGLSRDRRACGGGIWCAEDIDLSNVVSAERVRGEQGRWEQRLQ